MPKPLVAVVDVDGEIASLVRNALCAEFQNSFVLETAPAPEAISVAVQEAALERRLAMAVVSASGWEAGLAPLCHIRQLSPSTETVMVIDAEEVRRHTTQLNHPSVDRVLVRGESSTLQIQSVLSSMLTRWQRGREKEDGAALLRAGLAGTRKEKEAVYRFRYEIYVQEMQTWQRYADHERGLVEEPEDAYAQHFFAESGGRIVGCLRLNVMSDGKMESQESYGIDVLLEKLQPHQIAMVTRFLVSREYRGSQAARALMARAVKTALERGVEVALLDCLPPLIKHYERIGFRRYKDAFLHEDYGYVTPMVLLAADRKHLKNVRSPLLGMVGMLRRDHEIVEFMTSRFPVLANYPADIMLDEEALWKTLTTKLSAPPQEKIQLLDGLLTEDSKKLARAGTLFRVKAGDRFIRAGEHQTVLFVVLVGSVEIRVGNQSVAVIGLGEIVGEMTMLTGAGRSADVVALEDCELLAFSRESFDRLTTASPAIAARVFWNIARGLARRLSVKALPTGG